MSGKNLGLNGLILPQIQPRDSHRDMKNQPLEDALENTSSIAIHDLLLLQTDPRSAGMRSRRVPSVRLKHLLWLRKTIRNTAGSRLNPKQNKHVFAFCMTKMKPVFRDSALFFFALQ